MSFVFFITPQLVRVLDYHGNVEDVWVPGAPHCMAQFPSAFSSVDYTNQIKDETPLRVPFSVYYAPGSRSIGCQVEEFNNQQQFPLFQSSPSNFQENNCDNIDSHNFQSSIDEGSFQQQSTEYVNIPAEIQVKTHADPFSLLSCNGSYLIQNSLTGMSGFVSSCNQELGFAHPLGQIIKTQHLLMCSFHLTSGKTCFVKLLPHCIKFSSSLCGVSYVIDEASVRTCFVSFNQLEPEVTQSMWKRNCQFGVNVPRKKKNCNRYRQQLAAPIEANILNVSIAEAEPVVINRDGLRFYSETRELSNMTISTDDLSISSTLKQESGGGTGHINLRCFRNRFRQSVFFDGKSLQVKFHTQSASLNKEGKLWLS